MFDRFPYRAGKLMRLVRQEARRLGHDYIGTEHILLGLVQGGSGVAASVLRSLNVDLEKIRHEVEKLVSNGKTRVTMGPLPFTPRAKKVLELSLEEATNLGHTHIGTEHLLLGLILEDEGIAAQVLRNLKVKLEDVRDGVLDLLEDDEVPLTDPARWACLRAYEAATGRGSQVGVLDLLHGLLDIRDPELEALLAQWGVDPEGLRKNVENRLGGPPAAGRALP